MRMRTILGAACVVAISASPGGASPSGDANAELYSAGHVHQLENDGYFFPGTTVCVGSDCTIVRPLEVEQGSNVNFTNLDEEPHQVSSDKKVKHKKKKRPLFSSEAIGQGDQTEIITSELKPGSYTFHCEIHLPMKGTLVVK